MSTSDQQEQGPLTRKQLREIRLTGSTPVITADEAATAAEAAVPPVPPLPEAPKAEAPESVPTVDRDQAARSAEQTSSAPLTRRQARAQESVHTASVPVIGAQDESDEPIELEVVAEESAPAAPVIVAEVPEFSRPAPVVDEDDDEGVDDVEIVAPVSAAVAADSVGEVPIDVVEHAVVEQEDDSDQRNDVEALGLTPEVTDPDDVLADVDDTDDAIEEGERPVVNPAFGVGVLRDPADTQKPFAPSFDELLTVGDSTGSQHLAPSALIFTPSPGDGSLSGPVASTGEILVTGSYELPRGMGSQGHAHGTTDGKEVDAVLIDGELPASSSPTPIAASSAVSTIKPAGEVIRPPAPEKGNKLMLILAITAGGLALALAVVLVVAFTTNVF